MAGPGVPPCHRAPKVLPLQQGQGLGWGEPCPGRASEGGATALPRVGLQFTLLRVGRVKEPSMWLQGTGGPRECLAGLPRGECGAVSGAQNSGLSSGHLPAEISKPPRLHSHLCLCLMKNSH